MKNTILKRYMMCLSVTLILSVNFISAQQNEQRSELILLQNYLTGYCEEGENETFVSFIQKNIELLEPTLIQYVQQGVPDELIKKLEESLSRQYNERQKILSENPNLGLSKEDMDIVSRENQESFMKRKIDNYRSGFISQSIFGLSLSNSNESQAIIERIASDENNPYQWAAENALKKVYLKTNN